MRAKRVDANHAKVRDGLRKSGYDLLDLSEVGHGVPDLCVRHPHGFEPLFIEVKDGDKPPSARKLTAAELKWEAYCGAITVRVLSLYEALDECERWLRARETT